MPRSMLFAEVMPDLAHSLTEIFLDRESLPVPTAIRRLGGS